MLFFDYFTLNQINIFNNSNLKWALWGILPVYVTEEDAGDERVGLVLSLLWTNELNFCPLPPRFRNPETINFATFIAEYTLMAACFIQVIPLLVASEVYHGDKIAEELRRL